MKPSPNMQKFLTLISIAEGTSTSPITQNMGYDIIVSGTDGPERFDDYSHHPFENRSAKVIRPGLRSTAAGRYQILYRYWSVYQHRLHLPDFSPNSQDAVAVKMVVECDALMDVSSGSIQDAIRKCSSRWASLPGAGYGQPEHSLEALMDHWQVLNQNT